MEIALATKDCSLPPAAPKARAARKNGIVKREKNEDHTHQSASALSADAGLVFPNIRPGMRYEPAMAGR
jgi:hypothetical protein